MLAEQIRERLALIDRNRRPPYDFAFALRGLGLAKHVPECQSVEEQPDNQAERFPLH
jgi:hypothetical protein